MYCQTAIHSISTIVTCNWMNDDPNCRKWNGRRRRRKGEKTIISQTDILWRIESMYRRITLLRSCSRPHIAFELVLVFFCHSLCIDKPTKCQTIFCSVPIARSSTVHCVYSCMSTAQSENYLIFAANEQFACFANAQTHTARQHTDTNPYVQRTVHNLLYYYYYYRRY